MVFCLRAGAGRGQGGFPETGSVRPGKSIQESFSEGSCLSSPGSGPGSLNWLGCLYRWNFMLVRTLSKGRAYTGVTIGAGNVRRYFPKQMEVIELALDDLRIQCGLAPGFWDGQAQISDPRLAAWLELKNSHGLPGHAPVPLALIPCGKNSFRLRTIRPHERS